MRKHKHYAIFHKGGHRLPAPEGFVYGRRAHGLITGLRAFSPKEMADLKKRQTAGVYGHSSRKGFFAALGT